MGTPGETVRAPAALLAAALLVLVCARAATATGTSTLPWQTDEFRQSPRFQVLKHAINAAGTRNLPQLGPDTTLLAPSDQAFVVLTDKLGITMAQLRANKNLLVKLLLYHIIPDIAVPDMLRLVAIKGYPNVDQDWWIPTALDAGALAATPQQPNNLRMFSRGKGKLSFRGFASATANVSIPFEGVNIFAIDTVLVPKIGPFADCRTVADIISANANLTQLQAALQATDLWGLVSRRTFEATVFAPTNDAITQASEGLNTTVDALLADRANLARLVQYHASPMRLYNSNMHDGRRISTLLAGKQNYLEADLSSVPGAVLLEAGNSSARVVTTDLFACKAVVHIVDMLLVP